MSKTAAELVSFVKTKLGTNYVYGMKGAIMTEPQYNWLKSTYPSYIPDSDKAKIGSVCVDCSGLISWYTGIIRGSSSYKNTAARVLDISQIGEAVPGCALWKSGHIGIYIGNNKAIEAKGSAYGTVETTVSSTKWTHILWLVDIDYATSVPAKDIIGTNSATSVNTYTVIAGDTLSKIAKSYDSTVDTIVSANAGKYPKITANYIVVGWILDIPCNSINSPRIGMCTGNHVNVRSGPGTSYLVIRQLNKYNLFDILDHKGDWVKVNIVGLVGYVSSQYVTDVDDNASTTNTTSAANTTITSAIVGKCTGNNVNVRKGPGTNYAVLRQLNRDNLFDIIGIEDDWTKVNIVGTVGYVFSQYVEIV